jgi:excisionase family DNA binding protein
MVRQNRAGADAALASAPALQSRYRIAEVAEAYGVTPRTVRSWIAKGLLEREKVGNSVFIRADQIEAMLNRRKRKG